MPRAEGMGKEQRHPRFERVLLKLSGEVLMGERPYGIDPAMLDRVASEIASVSAAGTAVAVVIGGGNIFRGLQSAAFGMERVPADHMGMLATVLNALALAEALRRMDTDACVMTAIHMDQIAEPYARRRAVEHLARGRVVVLGGGTGNPFFTTDTAAALRAMELDAQVLLKATKVDGVYDADPEQNPEAKPFDRLTYGEVLDRRLAVMDLTAVSLAMGGNLPIIVFNLRKSGNVRRVVLGERVGTVIGGEG